MIGSGPGARRRTGIGGETDQRGWISFDIRDTHSLDEGQSYEILFVRKLAVSGLGDLWVERLLGELDPSYRYDPNRVAYSFAYGWVEMPPLPSGCSATRATSCGRTWLGGGGCRHSGPWRVLFEATAADRPAGASELIPYWTYQVPGGAVVDRRVPMFPLSREVRRVEALQGGIAVYRLAFGQPRQEDLLAFVVGDRRGNGPGGVDGMRISLEPREVHS